MPSNKLPPHIIEHWPEVFNDVEIKAIPLEYINSINVYFYDGKVWEIDVNKSAMQGVTSLEEVLESFFEEYDDVIDSVDFSLNTKKVKKDIKDRTRLFMKKRK